VGILRLPALRERGGDLELLLEHALEKANAELSKHGGAMHKKFSDSAKLILLSHFWPGNVRELNNTITRAALWSSADVIDRETARQSLLFTPDDDAAILERPIGNGFSLRDLLGTVASHYLERAMRDAGGVKAKAAKLLGFEQYQTLTNWLNKYRGK
jgi:DNA-binding NtrC family response regulator